ncbi:putative acyl-coenzyme A oxidase 3.2, peroxisomal isoform X2 [Spinacia oleracea]|uniref:Acyl-coenzyme A oxidase 3.2, peroxisomal isoform X2 n=1 Tax=Spinacia oleracea TaxID=3562 RepID=A0A9R0JKQ7_SPIOL|nr:putative acyl-coenzyme A oxidase 3.2, peroxisomal isoform X2 [Spinacia oleracea]
MRVPSPSVDRIMVADRVGQRRVERFAAFLAPLTSGRVNIAVSSIYISKVGLATALRYSLSRRAFSLAANEPEVLLLDYPSHQRRLLPLLAKTLRAPSSTRIRVSINFTEWLCVLWYIVLEDFNRNNRVAAPY